MLKNLLWFNLYRQLSSPQLLIPSQWDGGENGKSRIDKIPVPAKTNRKPKNFPTKCKTSNNDWIKWPSTQCPMSQSSQKRIKENSHPVSIAGCADNPCSLGAYLLLSCMSERRVEEGHCCRSLFCTTTDFGNRACLKPEQYGNAQNRIEPNNVQQEGSYRDLIQLI